MLKIHASPQESLIATTFCHLSTAGLFHPRRFFEATSRIHASECCVDERVASQFFGNAADGAVPRLAIGGRFSLSCSYSREDPLGRLGLVRKSRWTTATGHEFLMIIYRCWMLITIGWLFFRPWKKPRRRWLRCERRLFPMERTFVPCSAMRRRD